MNFEKDCFSQKKRGKKTYNTGEFILFSILNCILAGIVLGETDKRGPPVSFWFAKNPVQNYSLFYKKKVFH